MKKEELLRKRNLELVEENKYLKQKICDQDVIIADYKKAEEETNNSRQNLQNSLEELLKLRDEYEDLIKQLKLFKKSVKGRNAIERFVYVLKKK